MVVFSVLTDVAVRGSFKKNVFRRHGRSATALPVMGTATAMATKGGGYGGCGSPFPPLVVPQVRDVSSFLRNADQ